MPRLDRGIQYAAAPRPQPRRLGVLDRPVKCSARGHDRRVFGDIADTFSAHQVDDTTWAARDPGFGLRPPHCASAQWGTTGQKRPVA
ncbi:hypothetical protein XH96_03015 [Bradyrhizobium sp. CCBAU 51765]|nr:hypothetical protein XH96_03015 [Bradyrhizobium sp. CCBAU 51765]